MALKRYRVIVKELCTSCVQAKNEGTIVKDCKQCSFIRYNNVTRLQSFTAFIDKKFPNWVWFKVYEYVPGAQGRELATFKNWHKNYIQTGSKWEYTGESREIPTREQL